MVDPLDPTRRKRIPAGTPFEDLLVPVVRGGRVGVRALPRSRRPRPARATRSARLHPGIRRFVNPHQYPVGLALELHELKTRLVLEARGCVVGPRVYLDHNATTPLDPRVLEAMLPYLRETFGNPSSLHWFGQRARAAVEDARARVASLVGAEPAEIVFTASGSESDNMALRGAVAKARGAAPRRRERASSTTPCSTPRRPSPRRAATVDDRARGRGRAARPRRPRARSSADSAAVVSLMLANNETGVLQPVAEAARLAHERGALVHCDAVQAGGKAAARRARARRRPADALGAQAVRAEGRRAASTCGAGRRSRRSSAAAAQERNRRAGTENVAGIVGFGAAASLAREALAAGTRARRARCATGSRSGCWPIPGARRNGGRARVANTANVSFEGIDAEALVIALDLEGVAVSTGAACAAGGVEPSHVLKAMGFPPERVQSSLRLSLGRTTTEDEVDRAADIIVAVVGRQRAGRK